jgi:hypothetical protein
MKKLIIDSLLQMRIWHLPEECELWYIRNVAVQADLESV